MRGGEAQAQFRVPAPPTIGIFSIARPSVDPWVMPLAFSIGNGLGPIESVNGIGFDLEGDLLLYRKITSDDWDRFPQLMGISEVWITFAPVTRME